MHHKVSVTSLHGQKVQLTPTSQGIIIFARLKRKKKRLKIDTQKVASTEWILLVLHHKLKVYRSNQSSPQKRLWHWASLSKDKFVPVNKQRFFSQNILTRSEATHSWNSQWTPAGSLKFLKSYACSEGNDFWNEALLSEAREKKPIKVIGRNTEQHRKGKSVNTESVCIDRPHAYILHPRREVGRPQASLTRYTG